MRSPRKRLGLNGPREFKSHPLRPFITLKRMKIFLVRHGETEWNTKGLLIGHKDSSLTEKGIQQAKALQKSLSRISFDAIYSSDLGRAVQTAQILVGGQITAVKVTPHLRERNFGRFEGRAREELDAHTTTFKDLYENDKFLYKAYPEIESDEELVKRFLVFIEELGESPHSNVLAVCHGGVMKAILLHLELLAYKDDKAYAIHSISNSAMIVLEYKDGKMIVEETTGIEK